MITEDWSITVHTLDAQLVISFNGLVAIKLVITFALLYKLLVRPA